MAIYKSQIQEAVETRKQEAGELAKKFSTEAGKRVAVVSWKMSSRTYLVGVQFIGHLSPDLKVGDEYLYDGETMTIQYIVEAPKEVVEQTEPSQKETTTEVKEPEAKILHAIIFGQKRVKKDYNYKNVVYAVNLEAIEYHQPLAMKHHRAALLLNHMMGTGRLSGTRVYFKIHNMTTIAVTKLITEITNFLTKFDGKPMDEMELIGWLKKKARKDPFAV